MNRSGIAMSAICSVLAIVFFILAISTGGGVRIALVAAGVAAVAAGAATLAAGVKGRSNG